MGIEKHHLTDEQIEITQNCGTEPPFSGELLNEKRKGTYICVVCKDAVSYTHLTLPTIYSV